MKNAKIYKGRVGGYVTGFHGYERASRKLMNYKGALVLEYKYKIMRNIYEHVARRWAGA